MFSINSFHDLVILVSLNLNRGTEDLSLPFYPPLTLFFLFLQTLFCSRSKGVLRLQCHHKASPPLFFFCLAVPDLQFRALVILCSFCLAILSPRPSTSPAATPFSAYVCLILGGVVCLGLGVWCVMLRDFQLMGWRGWEGERGEWVEVIELEEKREEGEQSVLVQKASRWTIYRRQRWPKSNGNWKDFSGVLGIYFSWEIAVLHRCIEPQYLSPFYYKRQ